MGKLGLENGYISVEVFVHAVRMWQLLDEIFILSLEVVSRRRTVSLSNLQRRALLRFCRKVFWKNTFQRHIRLQNFVGILRSQHQHRNITGQAAILIPRELYLRSAWVAIFGVVSYQFCWILFVAAVGTVFAAVAIFLPETSLIKRSNSLKNIAVRAIASFFETWAALVLYADFFPHLLNINYKSNRKDVGLTNC